MKITTFQYHEALVEDGDLIELSDTVLIGPPQIIVKTGPHDNNVYIAWVAKVD